MQAITLTSMWLCLTVVLSCPGVREQTPVLIGARHVAGHRPTVCRANLRVAEDPGLSAGSRRLAATLIHATLITAWVPA